MGLITNAVKKVEEKESPPVEQETPPKPEVKRGLGKKKVVIAVAALLFLGASLGLGYLFLLNPTPEAPPKVSRRSISARKKPAKPATAQAEQEKDTGAEKTKVGKKETALAEISKKPVAGQEPTKESAIVSEQRAKTSAPVEEASDQTAENQISKPTDEVETPKPPIEKPQEFIASSTSESEEKITKDVISSEGEKEASGEYIPDETLSLAPEEIPSGKVTPPFPVEPKKWLPQKPLTVTERSDSRAQKYYKKGTSYQQQGEFSRAIDSYRKALRFNPDHLKAHMNLATAYLQIGRLKEAEKELVYLYALKPKDGNILFNLGLLLYKTAEYSSAKNKLKRLLELDPFHLEATLLLGSIYEERGELGKALESCTKAYRINSADPRAIYRLGRAWDLADEPTKAAKYYRLFLSCRAEKENQLELAVRDRLKYLVSGRKEK
ncbi:MAG: tetratricopeptide repeat protein [candidate division Zixibacteria bacterium]|nr:tetratricopeptide repeat protein [candidate division Zixibacteria bacterium]